MKLKLSFLLVLLCGTVFAQNNNGGIQGRVIGEDGKPLSYASVKAVQGGIVKGGKYTDDNGNFRIKPLSPGEYSLEITYTGYKKNIFENVIVRTDKMSKKNVTMSKGSSVIKVVRVTGKRKLIDDSAPGGTELSGKEIQQSGIIDVGGQATTMVGVNGTGESNSVSIGGDRNSGTTYMIDGMLVTGTRATNINPRLISNLQIMRTGVPAKYGDATGGIISITTRGISSKTTGGLQVQRSVEGYNNNFASLDISGPLITKKDSNGKKKPVMGYVLNVGGRYNKDPNPFYNQYPILKPEILQQVQETPLFANPNGFGFVSSADRFTADDFTTVKARQEGGNWNINLNGKLDFQPTDRINVRFATFFDYTRSRGFSSANSMLAPQANSVNINYSGRAFLRLTQTLGKSEVQKIKESDDEIKKKSAFSNAFYTLQMTYQREFSDAANPVHGRNTFDYGYLGKFEQETQPFYVLDTALGYRGLKYVTDQNVNLNYTPGGLNPLLENYTKQVMGDDRFDVRNLIGLQALGGLANGDNPASVYGLYTNVGSQITGYSYAQLDRFLLNLDASFDIEQGVNNKTRKDPIVHQIEFGLGYDQNITRNYGIGASALYRQMRLITNSHLQNLDLANPVYVVDGNEYTKEDLDNGVVDFSDFDTIRYNRLPVAADQSRFDKSLRTKLFGSETNTQLIDLFSLDPSNFSLDMFSADDLLNQGNDFVNYSGYDYLGNIQRKQPSFNDFWTQRDDRGDFTRPIAGFNPNYMWGYISDKFSYKDINFNIGLRIDRYDANQNVLRDPYSLYGVRDLSSLERGEYIPAFDETTRQTAPDPFESGFDQDWIPYVDNNQSTNKTLVGYRSGDVWYDPFGREIADPTILSERYANGLPIQPLLQDAADSLKSENYKINNAFEDYRPDIAISPRLQFIFPITDESLFYGNYDILTQRPSSNNFVTPDDYFFIAERRATINNANLRMERAANYTIGYEQAITKRSKIAMEVNYIERRDQIQLQQFILAYPISYTSYGNRDFSSTKSFIFRYELRRTGPIRLTVNYTLLFAEGTGSSTTSAQSLIASGQPNLRTIFPLANDNRHNLNVTLDYRYGMNHNKGPKIGNHYIFNGLGANLLVRTRSGSPFTRSSLATPLVGGDFNSVPIIGTRNGSRLPWTYSANLRVNKTFQLTRLGRKKDDDGNILTKSGRPLMIDAYTFIENILNTRNVIGVYSYTGVAEDDGYLDSPQGQQNVATLLYPNSFEDYYRARMVFPGRFLRPRRINLGFTLSF